MGAPVLYLGDTSLDTAAAYLAGVMAHAGIRYDYLPSDRSPGPGFPDGDWRLLVLSDYPAGNLTPVQMERVTAAVRAGRGLLMIGGWESFRGLGGRYAGTAVARALPVEVSREDDRVNCPYPCLALAPAASRAHPILAGLPWESPPALGGYNRVTLKPGSELLLEAVRFAASAIDTSARGATGATAQDVQFREEGRDPLLAVWSHGAGRVAAFCCDAAPHWVGGFVDWGPQRVRAGGAGEAGAVEVGSHYARFFENLMRWTAGI